METSVKNPSSESQSDLLSQRISVAKYARLKPNGKRETYDEIIARNRAMHDRKYASHLDALKQYWDEAMPLLLNRTVIPSARALQFGGEIGDSRPVEAHNVRIYNCSATTIDRAEAFGEAMYVLLCGTGVGYSVQRVHTDNLPEMRTPSDEVTKLHIVEDSIEGWKSAVDALIFSYVPQYLELQRNQPTVRNPTIVFSYEKIRKAGDVIKSSQGRAPGYKPLKKCLDKLRGILDERAKHAADKDGFFRIRPIDAHDMMCSISEPVVDGGTRRAAMIALFDEDDELMLGCKRGVQGVDYPVHRRLANNSAIVLRKTATLEKVRRVVLSGQTEIRDDSGNVVGAWHSGDPGIMFSDDKDELANPCAEIGLISFVENATKKRGWQFCNLSEIVAPKAILSKELFLAACRVASFIGTLQAGYTDMPVLGAVTEQIVRREALIGVSITGIFDCLDAFSPELLREGAEEVKRINSEVAAIIGINPAPRTTCIKPAGSTSPLGGTIAQGCNPAIGRRMIRRVEESLGEKSFEAWRQANPHAWQPHYEQGKAYSLFRLLCDGARTINETTAVEHLEIIKMFRENWVNAGRRQELNVLKSSTHNVSNTVNVRAHEWDEFAQYLFDHMDVFGGVAFMDYYDSELASKAGRGDMLPQQPVEEDHPLWVKLAPSVAPNYDDVTEEHDERNFGQDSACAGGACNV